jgi:hypothetical protein
MQVEPVQHDSITSRPTRHVVVTPIVCPHPVSARTRANLVLTRAGVDRVATRSPEYQVPARAPLEAGGGASRDTQPVDAKPSVEEPTAEESVIPPTAQDRRPQVKACRQDGSIVLVPKLEQRAGGARAVGDRTPDHVRIRRGLTPGHD